MTDFGTLPDGAGYIVMEYLKGETLTDRLARSGGKLSESEAVQIAWQLADTVMAAHTANIIHRDLKPSNVMLVPDPHIPSGERAKVLDFGLAKLTAVRDASLVKTESDAVIGTPLYMSPEQCQGAGRVDAKSDVYSLGCILYEMLSGRPPFEGNGPGEVIAKHLFHEPEPLRKVVPTLAPGLAELVDRMMVKSPAERPSMSEAARELGKLAEQLPRPTRRMQDVDALASTAGHDASEHASTLGRAATLKPPGMVISSRYVFALGVGLTICGAFWWFVRHQRSETLVSTAANAPTPILTLPVPVTSPTTERRITLNVISEPPDALVINAADGSILGSTPWQQQFPSSVEPLQIRLRLDGYAARQMQLPRQNDYTVEVVLTPLSPSQVQRPVSPALRRVRVEKKGRPESPVAESDASPSHLPPRQHVPDAGSGLPATPIMD